MKTRIGNLKLPIIGILATALFQSLEVCGAAETNAPAKTLPKQPWHVADVWWQFAEKTPHFESLDMDVTIDRDVSTNVNLYISPCGIAKMNGMDFYGGLQSSVNGWASKEDHTHVFPGHGAIFSRWSNDKKTKIGLEHVRMVSDGLCESAGYEGEFCSVRRPYAWNKGTYTWSIVRGDTEAGPDGTNTWFVCIVRDHATDTPTYIGSLRFEGTDFTFWSQHAAFVEVYSSGRIPKSEIPEVKITFGYPRLNGSAPKFKSASVNHPSGKEQSAAPDCATAVADGPNVVVTLGPIFEREAKDRRHALNVVPEGGTSK